MKKGNIITIALIVLVLIAGIVSIILYKLGDRIFEEIFNSQIIEVEKVIEQQEPGAQVNNQTIITEQNPEMKPGTAKDNGSAQQTADNSNQNMQISKDKIEEIKESVTASERMDVVKMVLSKLSRSDISKLTKLSAGGITQEEKEEIKSIIYSRFTQGEIEELRAMYNKYMR